MTLSTADVPKSLFLILAVMLASCAPEPASAQTFSYPDAFPGVSFRAPVDMTFTTWQPDRVYVVEQGGVGSGSRSRIQTVAFGSSQATTFIDLDARVSAGGEMGLLGMAFHPDYANNGKFYVDYTASNPRRTVISEFTRLASDSLKGDDTSERVLLEIAQPASNHNGGKVAFGPDGYLYISLGDGGNQGDPSNHAQNRASLLGKILRIDVDQTSGQLQYGIPASNPFTGNSQGWREEIFAFGFRNPWRFTFDSETGELWVGDVGQNAWEEVDVVTNGGNYGWRQMEGNSCYVSGCNPSAYLAPVHAYGHNSAGGYSITGGIVYRGSSAPALVEKYIFADFVSPRLWHLDSTTRPASSTLMTTTIDQISAIVEGPNREAYIVVYTGSIRRIVQNGVAAEGLAADDNGLSLEILGRHPFRDAMTLSLVSARSSSIHATLLDAIGRQLRVLFSGGVTDGTPTVIDVDGRDLAPGLYFVRIEAEDGATVVRRIVRAE